MGYSTYIVIKIFIGQVSHMHTIEMPIFPSNSTVKLFGYACLHYIIHV